MSTNREVIKTFLNRLKKENREILNPKESDDILRVYGIPSVKSIFCRNDLNEILKSSEKIGFPVVLKLISKEILHKSDAGCVALNLQSPKEVEGAFQSILQNLKRTNENALIEGFLVQKMVREGYEVIVGLTTDSTFGKVILFGLGGIFVEIFQDVAIRMVPITKIDAQDMIEEVKGYRILKGIRGKEPANLQSLREILLAVSQLGNEIEEIREMDLNPVFVDSSGSIVADSRILL